MSRRIIRLGRRASRLSFTEWRDLAQAQWSLVVAHAIVRSRPIGSLALPIARREDPSDAARLPEAEDVAKAISRAARFGLVRARCLVRAIALSSMLHARGITGTVVRIGVRRRSNEFDAHAWVELSGVALGEADVHVQSFVALAAVDFARNASGPARAQVRTDRSRVDKRDGRTRLEAISTRSSLAWSLPQPESTRRRPHVRSS